MRGVWSAIFAFLGGFSPFYMIFSSFNMISNYFLSCSHIFSIRGKKIYVLIFSRIEEKKICSHVFSIRGKKKILIFSCIEKSSRRTREIVSFSLHLCLSLNLPSTSPLTCRPSPPRLLCPLFFYFLFSPRLLPLTEYHSPSQKRE